MRRRLGLAFLALALALLAAPARASPVPGGLADDIRSGDPMRPGNASRVLATMSHEERVELAPELAPAVIDLFDHPHVGLRATALRMITMFKGGEKAAPARKALTEALEEKDAGVRAGTARALGCIGTAASKSEKALAGALEDDDLEVRAAAAEAVGRMGASDARTGKRLGKLLREKEPDAARAAAEKALAAIRRE